jgi:hypothetical protein
MRKLICIAGICGVFSLSAFSQTSVTRVYIKGGQDAWPNYLREVYLNPSFTDGTVEYKNGKKYKSRLNYNRVIGNIQFISESGDTLVLTDGASIGNVSIKFN